MQDLVIYNGQARSFAQTVNSHWFRLLRHLDEPTVIVSVAADEQAKDMELLTKFVKKTHIEYVTQPNIKDPLVQPGMLGIYPPSTDPQGILKQLWSLYQAWQFAKNTVNVNAFDRVIRIRPDLVLDRVEFPVKPLQPNECHVPWWASWGGVNDRFALMGPEAAEYYYGTWINCGALLEEGCPLHPETLIYESLRDGDIYPQRDLQAEFVTLRLDGSVVPMSITAADLAHFRR